MLQTFFSFIFFIYFFIFNPFLLGGKIYTGIAMSPIVENISSGSDANYYGTVKYVAKRGTLIEPNITDLKGKIVIPGTITIQQGTKYWKAMADADKANVRTSNQDLITASENLKRFKELAPSGAESIQNFQHFQNSYYNYLGAYIKARGKLLLDDEVLETRTQFAPFEGYVRNVMYTIGRASGNPETIEIAQLNPIGIKVKMDRVTAKKINASTPVTVHVPGTDLTQGIFNAFSILCEDGIIFLTENYPQTNNLTQEEQEKIKFKIKDFFPVEYFYINTKRNDTLCIPEESIMQDKKRYYVWRAKDRKFFHTNRPFNPIFKVEKIYITPGNLQRLFAGEMYLRTLKDAGELTFGDVVLANTPNTMKDNDTVEFSPKRYVFMPGQRIKIDIDI